MGSIIRSLLVTIVISLAISLAFYFMGSDPKKIFIISFAAIMVVGFLLGQWSTTKMIIKNKQLENERIIEFTKQGVSVECSYCSEVNFVPIRFDIKNEFDCNKCGKKNAIYLDIITTQITNPIQSARLQIQTINSDEQSAIDKIQTNG